MDIIRSALFDCLLLTSNVISILSLEISRYQGRVGLSFKALLNNFRESFLTPFTGFLDFIISPVPTDRDCGAIGLDFPLDL